MESQRKTQVLNRLKSIQGHLRGVQRMVEEEQYCIDIIQQTMAVQKAIDKVNAIVLENHLQTCVAAALRGDDPAERERVVGELLHLYEGGASVGLNRNAQATRSDDDLDGTSAGASACPNCGSSLSLAGGSRE